MFAQLFVLVVFLAAVALLLVEWKKGGFPKALYWGALFGFALSVLAYLPLPTILGFLVFSPVNLLFSSIGLSFGSVVFFFTIMLFNVTIYSALFLCLSSRKKQLKVVGLVALLVLYWLSLTSIFSLGLPFG